MNIINLFLFNFLKSGEKMKSKFFFLMVLAIYLSKLNLYPAESWILYDDSLQKTDILCSRADRSNFVYWGTSDGLLAYYINTWEKYNSDNVSGFSPEFWHINQFANDMFDNMWGATDDGLMKFSPFNKTFSQWNNDSNPQMGNHLKSITTDQHLNKWMLSNTPYLTKFDGSGSGFINYELNEQIAEELNMDVVNMTVDAKDTLWIIGKTSVIKFADSNFIQYTSDVLPLENKNLVGMAFSSDFSIIVGSKSGELINYKNGTWNKMTGYEQLLEETDTLQALHTDGYTRTLWMSFRNKFKLLHLTKNNTWELINIPNLVNSDTLAISVLSSELKQSNLWIGTKFQGILKYNITSDINDNSGLTNQFQNLEIISISPNPSSLTSTATILCNPDLLYTLKIGIYNYLGIEVMSFNGLSDYDSQNSIGHIFINSSNLTPGVYFINIHSGKERRTKTFIVE